MTLVRDGKPRTSETRSRPREDSISYESDPFIWAVRQAEFLRAGRLDLCDTHNIADVAHDLSDRPRGDLVRVIQHLPKWDHQPERSGR